MLLYRRVKLVFFLFFFSFNMDKIMVQCLYKYLQRTIHTIFYGHKLVLQAKTLLHVIIISPIVLSQ